METFMKHLAATSAAIPAEMSVPEIVEAILREMEVGDSRLFAEEAQSNISARTYHMKPRKYVTRKEGDGTRVWRVE